MSSKRAVPRDRDKMVRQLSLVAYLMSTGGRKVSARTIRWEVEGYGDENQTDEAFARRFYADREELASLGIEIMSENAGGDEGDVYWLPKENFFLPPVEFTGDELAALHTCLCLLDEQFAYSRLLRLALQSLALGSGNALDDPATGRISVNLLSSGYDATIAGRQSRIETAISKRKTIAFDYYALEKNIVEERRVDPYGLMHTRGDWYLVGRSHKRSAIRIFKLRRIRGKIRNVTKSEHDFDLPTGFNLSKYTNLEPWQLGPVTGQAEIHFSERMAWWAANNLSRCGELNPGSGGAAVFQTDYSDGGQVCSLVLGLGGDATLAGPPELRAAMLEFLIKIETLHTGSPPKLAGAAEKPAAAGQGSRFENKAPQVKPERFSQLAQAISYLIVKLDGRDMVTLPVTDVCGDLGFDRNALGQAADLLRLVNTGAGGYLIEAYVEGGDLRVIGWPGGSLLKRPARLSPREARAMLLAIDLVGGRIMSGGPDALQTARDKIIEAAGGLGETETIPVEDQAKSDPDVCHAISKGLNEHRLVEIEYRSQDRDDIERRRIEPYLINNVNGRWYLVAYCLERRAERTFSFEMIKGARLLPASFTPREIDIERYQQQPGLPSGEEAPHTARVRFSPEVARRVLEQQSGAQMLEDGSLIADIPYFTENWLCREILKYRGEAVVISPEGLRREIAENAAVLTEKYH